MNTDKTYINLDDIKEMLYGDETYINEFAQAATLSFKEFVENYEKYLLIRDEINFRKTGHKIKPVALMLHIHDIVEEYEYAKTLLIEEKSQQDLQDSVARMNQIVSKVLRELEELS